MGDLKYIAFLAAIYVFLKFGPAQLINRIIMALLGKSGLESVGRKALAAQPDRITLVTTPAPTNAETLTALSSLERRGFQRAGSFIVRELKGVTVHLLVKPADSAMAVVYEHLQAGVWADVASRYANGTSFTLTNARAGGGLEPKPGNVTVRAPGLPPATLAMRLVKERPAGSLLQVSAADFPRVFEQAYAEETAWRKGKGLSAAEVKAAGKERISV